MGWEGYVMTMSRNGQVSIPAATRARWQARQVLVADLGDRVVIRPIVDTDPVAAMRGKYTGRGPDTDALRAAERHDDRLAEGRDDRLAESRRAEDSRTPDGE